MDLWIRSQDKLKIVKINYVYAEERDDHFTIIGETIDSGPIIGIYKTKERVLEVLDEIQSLLIEYVNFTEYKIDNKYTTRVYEMPKE